MASIAELIQQNLNNRQATTQGDAQADVQRLLAAKAGRAGVSGPRASSIGQNVAQQQVAGQQRQLDLQGALLGQQVAAQGQAVAQQKALSDEQLASQRRITEQQLAAQAATGAAGRAAAGEVKSAELAAREEMTRNQLSNAADQAAKELASERGTTLDQIFAGFRQSNAELAQRKDAAQLEQLGFTLALRDKEYIRDLQEIGQLRRLQNDLSWKEEVQRVTFGEDLNNLLKALNWESAYNADERAWGTKMANMGASQALDIANAAYKQEATKQTVSGIIGAGKAYYTSYEDNRDTTGGSTSPGTDGTYTTQPTSGKQGYN